MESKIPLPVDKSVKPSQKTEKGYTLIELLAVIFIITITGAIYSPVAKKYGVGTGIGAGFITIVVCVLIIIQFYRWSWRSDKKRLQELREKYQTIYRVNALPADKKNLRKATGAEIKIGDFGWEAGPLRKDGLIYLQGLTPEWYVVWHAGFRPEQIEKVALKSASQYDHWHPDWAKVPAPSPCPFPILARPTPTMGLAHHTHRYFENYPSKYSKG
jgi:prepilin-type N-terminal cleavage/methylation domain-containing protein